MSTNKNSKSLGKGKKAGIIGGCAVVGGVLTDALLIALAPATGGLSTVALVAKKTIETSTAAALVGAGVVGAGGGGVILTKIIDKKREENAYKQGCEDASKQYEAKFEKQAQEFANKYSQILNDNKKFYN